MNQVVVGIDFGIESAQISYYNRNMSEPETISTITGKEQYAVPVVLCKQKGKNRWFYGEEARKMALKGEGLLITDLLEKAVTGQSVDVENEVYSALQLLVIFVRKMWNGCIQNLGDAEVLSCMICVENLSGEMVDLLYELVEFLPIESEKVFFQSHGESFYYYELFQNERDKQEARPAICVEEQNGVFHFYHLKYKNSTARLTLSKQEITSYGRYASTNEAEKDRMFLNLIKQELEKKEAALVYLIGSFFEGDWMKESLRYICQGRRVFLGDNLFSKGSAFAAYFKENGLEEPWTYLGENQIRLELALDLGDNVCKLTSIGEEWYEADVSLELVLEGTDELAFLVRDEMQNVRDRKVLRLEGLPRQESFVTSVQVELYFESPTLCQVEVTDIGFGDITPATNSRWEMALTWEESL